MVPGQVAQGHGAVLCLGGSLQHGALLLHPWEQAAPEDWWLGPRPGWEPLLRASSTGILHPRAWLGTNGDFPHVPHVLAPFSGSFGAGAPRGRGCRRVPARSFSPRKPMRLVCALSRISSWLCPRSILPFLPIDQETPQLLGAAAATARGARRGADADPAAQDAAARHLHGANPNPELGGSSRSAPSPCGALFSAATAALARGAGWAPAAPVPWFWKDFFAIRSVAGCRRGRRAGARWLRLGCSGALWMATSPGLGDPAVCSSLCAGAAGTTAPYGPRQNLSVARGCVRATTPGGLLPVSPGTSVLAGALERSLLSFPAN